MSRRSELIELQVRMPRVHVYFTYCISHSWPRTSQHCKMTPNSTGGRRKIESFAFRSGAKGARIRDLCGESFRTVGSFLNLVHKTAISQAAVGDHFRSPYGAVWNSFSVNLSHRAVPRSRAPAKISPSGTHSLRHWPLFCCAPA